MRGEEVLVDLIAARLEQVSVSEDAHVVSDFVLSDEGLDAIIDAMDPAEIMRAMERCGKVERFVVPVSEMGDAWRLR